MTRLQVWALAAVLMVLMACSEQSAIPAATPTEVATTAEASPLAPSPTNIIPTPPTQSTPAPAAAAATPTPTSSTEPVTAAPTQVSTSDAATILVITVSQIPTDIPEYDRSQWKHWADVYGN